MPILEKCHVCLGTGYRPPEGRCENERCPFNTAPRGTFVMDVEYTDTFGGEANYSWVERRKLTLPIDTSDRTIMRRAKASVGLTGVRGRTFNLGDSFEFRPYGYCSVLFVTTRY